MKVFLSHASEDRAAAEQIQLALGAAGHEVFFDEQSLPPGGDYNRRIRASVEQSDFLVFLISPDAVKPGRYTLTELKYARQKWPSPVGRVLPVIVRATPFEAIPAYLKAVTVLEPVGNLAAETADAFERLSGVPQPAGPAGALDGAGLREADVLTQTEEDLRAQGAPPALVALLKASVALGKWTTEVVRQGRPGCTYKETFDSVDYLATPSADYTDERGRRCRTVRCSKRQKGRWLELSPVRFLWKDGDWSPVSQSPGEPDQPGSRERRVQALAGALQPHEQRLASAGGRAWPAHSATSAATLGADGVVQLDDDEAFVTCSFCNARVKARNLDLHMSKVHSGG